MPRPTLLTGPRTDAAVAAALLVAGQVEVWTRTQFGGDGPTVRDHRLAAAIAAAAITGALAGRRRSPMAAATLVALGLVARVLLVGPSVSFVAGELPLAIESSSLAAWGPARGRFAGLGLLLGAYAVLVARVHQMQASSELVFGLIVLAASWAAGDLARRHRHRTDALEAERDTWRSEAVAEERDRIARELHDVIAHSVSLMGVQAGAARSRLDVDPERTRAALVTIEQTARESIVELRRLLSILREPDGDAGLAPQPGMAEIEPLVGQMRGAGLEVDFVVVGQERTLPPGVALSAFRIVQEALTNTLKHAGGAPAEVRITYGGERVELEVTDSGQPSPARPGHHGQGLIGMRERVALYGGSLEAGARDGGGFRVLATLPGPTA